LSNDFTAISDGSEIFFTLIFELQSVDFFFLKDTQHCPLRMASYGYLDTDMELNWRDDADSVIMANPFVLPRFRLNSFERSKCASVTTTGSYGCIVLMLEFERQFGFYLIQIYAPSIMVVLVSWVAFWLGKKI